MAFRFIHSADIHLDSPLKSLAIRNEDLFNLIGGATRQAFLNIVELCLREQVDALILAGDIYDGDQTSMKTAKFFAIQMNRLREANIGVYVIRGNHDCETKISNELTLPSNVNVFTGKGGKFTVPAVGGGPEIVIHGISFAESKAPVSLLPKFKPPVESAINIGILHTSLVGTGEDGHNPYAPCTTGDLQAFGYRYWALGHIHKRTVLEGNCTVVMPGNTQGRDINEAGAKTVTLVTVHDDGTIELEERLTGVAEFKRIKVNLDGCEDWSSVVAAMAAATTKAKDAARSEHLVTRLLLTGATPAAWELRAKPDHLKAEAEASAPTNAWIENIEIDCRPVTAGLVTADSGDALAEIMSDIENNILSSDGFIFQTNALAKELLSGLPKECHSIFDAADETEFKAEIAKLARQGAEDVLARLRSAPEKDSI